MMKIYARLAAAVLIACFSAGLSACNSFHEWPEGGRDDPTLIRTTLRLHVDFTPFAEGAGQAAESPPATINCAGRSTCLPMGKVPKAGGSPGRWVTSAGTPGGETTFEVPFDLHAGKYRVSVWGDYVRKGATADVYYNTADLSAVTVIFPYTGSTDARDAFSGCAEIDLTPYRDRYFAEVDADVTLQRACGKFRIRTNDLAELAARRRTLQESPGLRVRPASPDGIQTGGESKAGSDAAGIIPPVPVTVRVSYSSYFPCGYNVTTGYATGGDFRTDVAFTGAVSELGPTSAVLAFDYVFICTESTVVYADIEAYDAAGGLISRNTGIRVPLERGELTTVEGAFPDPKLRQRRYRGIDDRFDGEIVRNAAGLMLSLKV
ncbi:MAG: DUF6562 domain-containing protein [Alistipes indistinctus]